MKILVVDIGGTGVKVLASGRKEPVEVPSSSNMSAKHMVGAVQQATQGWEYDAVSIGIPGVVVNGHPAEDPPNLGTGWVRFNYKKAFGCPVRIINDAAMQALGSYRGKRMLFLGLGTGLGSALVIEGIVHPLELGDLPYECGASYANYVGAAALKRLGERSWISHVLCVVEQLRNAMQVDYVVVGGGKAKLLKSLPKNTFRGDNSKAFLGGFRLWESPMPDMQPLVRHKH